MTLEDFGFTLIKLKLFLQLYAFQFLYVILSFQNEIVIILEFWLINYPL